MVAVLDNVISMFVILELSLQLYGRTYVYRYTMFLCVPIVAAIPVIASWAEHMCTKGNQRQSTETIQHVILLTTCNVYNTFARKY